MASPGASEGVKVLDNVIGVDVRLIKSEDYKAVALGARR